MAAAAVEGARVIFGILNYSAFFPAAEAVTGSDGTAGLTCGLGSIHLRAVKGNAWCEQSVNAAETDRAELVLTEAPPAFDTWEDFVSRAPKDSAPRPPQLTEAQRAVGREKSAAAKEIREDAPPPPPGPAGPVPHRHRQTPGLRVAGQVIQKGRRARPGDHLLAGKRPEAAAVNDHGPAGGVGEPAPVQGLLRLV